MKNSREKEIDNIRGFAILTVVLGHSLQACLGAEFDQNILFRYIYSFHMPLFIFISGYVNWQTFDGSSQKYFVRTRSLLIPYFIWCFIMYAYNFTFSAGFTESLGNVFWHVEYYWFLWVLFICITGLYIAFRLTSRYEEVWLLAIWLVLYIQPYRDVLGVDLVIWQLPFFITGYMFHKYKSSLNGRFFCHTIRTGMKLNNRGKNQLTTNNLSVKCSTDNSAYLSSSLNDRYSRVKNAAGIVCIALFLFAAPFWDRTQGIRLSAPVPSYLVYIWKYLVAFLGIISVFFVFYKGNKYKTGDWIGKTFGHVTLEIYVIHYFLIFGMSALCLYGGVSVFFSVIFTFFISLFGSLGIEKALKPCRWCNFILFGKKL